MAVNKVVYDGETLVDLTGDTVTPETMLVGATAHNRSGEQIAGAVDLSTKADKADLTAHINDKSNPHGVTVEQIGAVEKTTHEYNKELAIGQYGKVCIGKFPMYDSNITVEINSTTDKTYHGTLVIATQNINESLGGVYQATVYGDATNSLTDSIKIEYLNGSRVFSVYINLPSWSKNLLHIQCVALRSTPTDIATLVDEIPSTATIVPTNAYNNLALKSEVPSKTETWTFTLEDGSTVTKAVYVG